MKTKDLYKSALTIAIPVMIQNAITNIVGMVDNLMVGQLGTEEMTGVSVVNQLLFVFNLTLFGAVSGAGIFGAQFYGKGDAEGVRHTFRFKIVTVTLLCLLGAGLLYLFNDPLISFYLKGETQEIDPALTLQFGKQYAFVILVSLLPFGLEQAYASTLRECGRATPPMVAGVVAVILNTSLNYLLIFGKFGFPKMGVEGAALATVIARFVQCGILIAWTHANTKTLEFAKGLYRKFSVPAGLVKQIFIKGTPLTINEMLWAGGSTIMLQCYSMRELDILSSMNISSTVSNVFNVSFIAFASGISIVLGQLLGAGKLEEAKKAAPKLIAFSVVMCVFVGMVMALVSRVFPDFYNTTEHVKKLATDFIFISACCMPIYSCANATYFVLRSGGKTIVTFLFDSCFVWVVCVPCAYLLVNYTTLGIVMIFSLCQMLEAVKCLIGLALVKKGVWVNTMV